MASEALARAVAAPQLVSEEALLAERAAAGDLDAFDKLVTIHQERVLSFAFRLVNDVNDAEDIAQDAFLKAFRSLPRLRDRTQFSSWLLKITINAARDHFRRKRRHDELPLEEGVVPALGDTTYAQCAQRSAHETLLRLLRALPERHRLVLVLRDIEGLSYREMAQVMGCTLSSVKNRLHRARRAFRDRLRPYLDEIL